MTDRQRRPTRIAVSAGTRLRLRAAILALAAALVLPTGVALGAALPTDSGPAVANAATTCTRTVRGFTASAVHAARDRAGVGGTVCFPAGRYTGDLRANVRGQTWRLNDNATLTGRVVIAASKVRLNNGTIERPSNDRWLASVEVRAHDVTVISVRFVGGGTGINIYGKDRTRITWNSFRSLSGSAISIWSEGVGADETYIDNNSIVQTITHQVSPITSRGNESTSRGGVQNKYAVIRKNKIDQGAGDIGWFGIELKHAYGTKVESNTIKGGRVLIALLETDRAVIRYNRLDLRGSAEWGIEVANARYTNIRSNTFIGDGPGSGDWAVAQNTRPLRTLVQYNRAVDLRTIVQIAGDYHRITDNCRTRVKYVYEFLQNGGSHIVIARNGPC